MYLKCSFNVKTINIYYLAAFISAAFNSRYFGKVLKLKLSNGAIS